MVLRAMVAVGTVAALFGGCAPGGDRTEPVPVAWRTVAEDCPTLTAAPFAGRRPDRRSPDKVDTAEGLSITCHYGLRPPAVSTYVLVFRDSAARDRAAEGAREEIAKARAGRLPMVALPGFGDGTASAVAQRGAVRAFAWSGNALVAVIVEPVRAVASRAELDEHTPTLAAMLRDLLGNLRP